MGNIAVEPLSRAKIRGRAAFLRNVLGLQGLYIRIDIVLEIMSCPMKNADPLIEMEICEDYEMPNEYAVYPPQKNLLRIRNSVYEGACAGNPRDRFTLAHELGHFFLHRYQTYQFARSEVDIPAYRDPEWQANTFASEFLMPHDKIQGMSVEDVMKQCGTSRQAAEIALKK